MSTLKVNKIRDTAGSADSITLDPNGGAVIAGVTTVTSIKVGAAVTISESGIEASGIGITCANINGTQIGGRRNIIINGAMLINQRASSYTSTGEEYTLDRFEHRVGSSFTFDTTTTQDSSAPAGFSKSLKITPDSTQTPTGSHNAMIGQLIEADDLVRFAHGTSSAKKAVLSFYAKSASQNNGHQYSVQLTKLASSGQYYYVNKAFTVTSSWQRFTVAFAADTSNDITTGNGEGFRILFHLAAGSSDIGSEKSTFTAANGNFAVTGQSNFMDNTSNEFYLTGVQLEASDSDVATDFEHRSIGEELQLCKRYCQVYKTDSGGGTYTRFSQGIMQTTSSIRCIFYLSPEMRAIPSATDSGSFQIFPATGLNMSNLNIESGTSSLRSAILLQSSGMSGTAGSAHYLSANDDADANIIFDSEL